jgi:ABC-2 type transport system ATP-binding protein
VAIVVEDYHKGYGTFVAVEGVSFRVEPGEILGLVGPNGAGKTTTLKALAGILSPTRGRVSIGGFDLAVDPVNAKKRLCYVPDDPKLFDALTVWEHLQFVAAAYRLEANWKETAESLLVQFELTEKRTALITELSRGMRQKIAIACGYLHEPKAILLDEPLTGLDPRGIRTMKDSIRRRAEMGTAVIISSHLLSLVEDMCTSVLMLNRGKVVLRDKIETLRQKIDLEGRSESLEELFFRLTEAPEPAEGVMP